MAAAAADRKPRRRRSPTLHSRPAATAALRPTPWVRRYRNARRPISDAVSGRSTLVKESSSPRAFHAQIRTAPRRYLPPRRQLGNAANTIVVVSEGGALAAAAEASPVGLLPSAPSYKNRYTHTTRKTRTQSRFAAGGPTVYVGTHVRCVCARALSGASRSVERRRRRLFSQCDSSQETTRSTSQRGKPATASRRRCSPLSHVSERWRLLCLLRASL